MGCVCLVCGIPGVGKSTMIQNTRLFPPSLHTFPIEYDLVEKNLIERMMKDDKLEAQTRQRTPETWKRAREIVRKFVFLVVESGFNHVILVRIHEEEDDGHKREVLNQLVEQWNHFRHEEEGKWRKSNRDGLLRMHF
jgi:broad-specificity NMP kinase